MLLFNGKRVDVPGYTVYNYVDKPTLRFSDPKDYGFRSTFWIRGIVLHTRLGLYPQSIVPSTHTPWGFNGVSNASKDDRVASWHISIDEDGFVYCHLDLIKHKAYHAGQVNEYTIGIEMFQNTHGGITQKTLDACVAVCDAITKELSMQRQYATEKVKIKRFASPFQGDSPTDKLAYLPEGRSGKDFVGIYGHRNCTSNRGQGDPGNLIFDELAKAGYEGFAADQFEDLHVWEKRQKDLGMSIEDRDGVPGSKTTQALKWKGQKPRGLWVTRPGD